MSEKWPTKDCNIVNLHLDPKNPRLGRETLGRAPREILQYLFDNDKAMIVAESIVQCGYFPNEPLLAIKENGNLIVVEGNRRLAALKALAQPGLIEGKLYRQLERLSRQILNPSAIKTVPVTIAPTRRATDRQIAARHIGTPVLAWQAENRASFILEKLSEGYSNDQLRDELHFSIQDIQAARQTRAIADIARSIDLPEEMRGKLEAPRTNVFTTIERVIDSTPGRKYLHIEKDPEHGIHGSTTKVQFIKGFKKLLTDVLLGEQTSRTLNTSEDIRNYFESWSKDELPEKKRGAFVPSDIIAGKSIASKKVQHTKEVGTSRSKQISKKVLPKTFKIRSGSDRLRDIRRELVKLDRDEYPNAGAVLLRVFFELAVVDYLDRVGELPGIIQKLEKKNSKLSFGKPKLSQLTPEILRIVKSELTRSEALMVEKAIKYDSSAPFSISDMHGFVHNDDFPSARDILQFWNRIEPLMKLMLEDGK